MAKPKIRARYAVKSLGKQPVTYNKCEIDKETKSLQIEKVTEDMDCYMVYFPQGHSIRVTSFERLKELGYDKKPRMVDMNTGDIVDVGGDPYDFANNPHDLDEMIIEEDEGEDNPITTKRAKEKA